MWGNPVHWWIFGNGRVGEVDVNAAEREIVGYSLDEIPCLEHRQCIIKFLLAQNYT